MSRVKCNFAAVQAELSKHSANKMGLPLLYYWVAFFFSLPAIFTRVVRYMKDKLWHNTGHCGQALRH